MSVDQELARAVEEAEAEASVPAVAQAGAAVPPAAPGAKSKRSIGLLVALLAIVGAVLALVFTSFEGSAIYSMGVDQLLKEPARYSQRNVRVKGMLVKGTLARRDDPCEYRFKLQENGQVLAVEYPQCVVPDTFRDMPGMDVEVTAEGKLAGSGATFVATSIMAKCPSKYEMKQKSMSGEMAPHAGQQASPVETLSRKD
jgi:cytochrome c-type biogenesis protein CcmE